MHRQKRKLEDFIFTWIMRLSVAIPALVLGLILFVITSRGLDALSWEMLTKPPEAAFYLGGGGGILNAIAGSALLALGATALALLMGVPMVLYLHSYGQKGPLGGRVRLALDVMWGIPSIVYGAFGFALMVMVGLRASLLAGIITLAFLFCPFWPAPLTRCCT
jgi:phosphate transport system permease protein